MSVLACSRKDCDNIMCDRLSDEHGYICNRCFSELVELGLDTDVGEFLNSSVKGTSYEKQESSESYFSRMFPFTDF